MSIDAHIKRGEPQGVYLLLGSENAAIAEAVTKLREATLTQAADFNRNDFRAGETSLSAVIDAANTLPMMAPRRFVHLEAVHKVKAAEQQALMDYVQNPSPSTVLCMSAPKLDQRTKFGKTLSKSATVFKFDPPTPRELPGWLEQRARAKGIELAPDAADLIAELVGPDTGTLDRTLEKVVAYAGETSAITLEHVEAVIAPTRVNSIFDLTDAIGRKQLPQALGHIQRAMRGGENALMMLAMMTRHLRQLIRVKECMQRRTPQRDIAKACGLRPFLVDSFVRQAQAFSMKQLCQGLCAAAAADEKLKSTRLPHSAVLSQLVLDIAAGPS